MNRLSSALSANNTIHMIALLTVARTKVVHATVAQPCGILKMLRELQDKVTSRGFANRSTNRSIVLNGRFVFRSNYPFNQLMLEKFL